MRFTLALVTCSLLAVPSFAADDLKPTGDAVVPKGAKLELLFTRSLPIKGGLTEGPAVAPDGRIYFSDIPEGKDKGKIMRFDLPGPGRWLVTGRGCGWQAGVEYDPSDGA